MNLIAPELDERRRQILTGMVTLALLSALTVLGIKIAFGALDGGYHVKGVFSAAGQGLIEGSDVQIRGVDVGEVSGIDLVDGRAVVEMRINDGEKIPEEARAVIRPKTLFGEKFVDLEILRDAAEPYLADGDTIEKTLGGFELERVLADAYPILEQIDPKDLTVIVGTLADAGKGLGPVINRQFVNTDKVLDVNVAHDADTRQFLSDLALLSDELAGRADDVIDAARDLNVALPPLNERSDELATVLDQASRLSNDVADILEHNTGFMRKNVTQGGKALAILADRSDRIGPLVTGLRQYLQTLAEVIRLPLGDGTRAAAVKGITGGDLALLFKEEGLPFPPNPEAEGQGTPRPPASGPGVTVPPAPTVPPTPTTLPQSPSGTEEGDLDDLFGGLFG